jgi:hypothetical protein
VKYMLMITQYEAVWDNLSGHPLYPSSSATSVRVRDGRRLVTDGPFAETREHLGGYIVRPVREGAPRN